MDEYLSEKEQLEQIRQWWSDYGWYVLGGVIVTLLGFFGYQRYQDSLNASAEAASALYTELATAVEDDDQSAAETALAALRAEHAGSPYVDNGALMLARMVLVSDPQRAIAELRSVLDNATDAQVAMVARLRLARVLSWREQHDEALALLDVEDSGAFAARMSEIRGDILLAKGDEDAARSAYTAALIMPGAESIDRNFLQMKLSSLIVQPASAASESAPAIDLEAVESAVEASAVEAAGEPDGAGETQ